MEVTSKGKCSECKQSFNDMITVRGKAIKIKKCQNCFDKSTKCSKCKEMGHRPRNCKKVFETNTRDQEESEDESDGEDESRNSARSTKSYLRKSRGQDVRGRPEEVEQRDEASQRREGQKHDRVEPRVEQP